ncbi:ABC transporter substrate-binding protein [Uliginosibacterium sp. 31-12]|uniref:ABC transporter substrate-binding protein n=1 Tax=Uliginosibacterium sp. 31-12 TaxID=3062781 RepID=UPI0026E2033C|nr:ABC transporter substrate-binding protein [Uliginosibacterium sp. 31-12]MDO6384796.1 ABC transporter substrate-binding protein [Uliginosibacterium sp. 31-12]
MKKLNPQRAWPRVVAGVLIAAGMGAGVAWAGEAPELAAQVAAGKLPALAQRLPEKPEVISQGKPGQYGGTIRSALRGNGDGNAILRMIGVQGLARWKLDFSGVVPNLAESWSTNADVSEYIFKLRRGLRWSDGAPFTSDDILFAVNDLLANKQFLNAMPAQYQINDKPMQVDKIDEQTVRFRFAGTYRQFVEQLATPLGQHPVMFPKHYCSQFHPKYNPKVDELIKAASAKDWAQLLRIKCGEPEAPTRWGNPDKPTLDPWVVKEPYSGGATKVLMQRNPYFWQVDSKGQQLPYVDKVQFQVISEIETIVLAAINGQLDFQVRHIDAIQNRPLLSENAAKGKYTILNLVPTPTNSGALFLNYTTKNAKLRELIRTKDFRIALSLALNRKEINDIVYLGQGEPWQIGPLRQHRLYNEKLAKQYTDYDPKQANALLDKLGLAKRDGDGYRQYPSGGRISLYHSVMVSSSQAMENSELIRKHFKDVGIELVIRPAERTLHYDRAKTNDYDTVIEGLNGGMDPTLDPRGYVAVHATESRQGLPWVRWYETHGKEGEAPTENMQKRLKLYDQWIGARSDREADELFRQILALCQEEFEIIGTVRNPPTTGIRNAKLMNVPERFPYGWTYASPGATLPQQFYYVK